MFRHLLSVAIIAVALGIAAPADARALHSVKVTETAKLPAERPDWPVPNEARQVFYVQRSTNSNTIVYTANFDADGTLDRRNPISVFWMRYDSNGARKPLSFFERQFAFGINDRRGPTPGTYTITPKALSKIKLELRQNVEGEPELLGTLGGRVVRLVYAYVTIDESGFIDRVAGITVHGIDPTTGRAVTETFRVTGGEILQ